MATTESQKKATIKYARTHLKRVPLDLKKDYYDAVKVFLDERGQTVNGYIKAALSEKLAKDGFEYKEPDPLPDGKTDS